jgi:hypothetical protein
VVREITVPKKDNVDIFTKLAYECLSLNGIMQTIGENFAAETQQLFESKLLCPVSIRIRNALEILQQSIWR